MSTPETQQGPPGPAAELAVLKVFEGTWECTATFAPGAPFPPMTGTETNVPGLGGLWLISEVSCRAADGTPFLGHGIYGWDAARRKYVSAWVDSFTPMLATAFGDADRSGKVLTFRGEQPDPQTGNMVPVRSVSEVHDAGRRTFTMYAPGPDGREAAMMTITYRRKA